MPLEIVIDKNIGNQPLNDQFIAVICHPNPDAGGTMNNKVVTTLSRTFNELGIIAIRFNFREAGKEIEETLSAIHYAQTEFPQAKIFLAGFSFGAYAAFAAAFKTPIHQLILIAPPVTYNYKPFQQSNFLLNYPSVIVIAEQDELVPSAEIHHWAARITPSPVILTFETAGHFFHGHLLELRNQLKNVLLCNH